MESSSENRLGREKSPYLLQHKDNPIAWQPWGEPAFRQAREQNKPVFLSIGYSTCHWCHVMAHESFEDQEVAAALNRDFVCIKVDREERPDVDSTYMSALQAMSGGGGWPMSVWLTPDGKPFFAGTYFPKMRFLQLLRRIEDVWKNQRASLLQDGDRLIAALRQEESPTREVEPGTAEFKEVLASYITHFQHHFDETYGGFGHAPKFPQTMNLMLMMRQDFKTGLRQAEAIVNTTLLNMVRGGIYDQLRGGFHRYSVDERWLVPHFEKMLYDQALLTVTLLEANELYGEPELERGARETLEYVLREMTHAQGGFFSAQDADSLDPVSGHSEEGHFCTSSFAELAQSLNAEELAAVREVYGVSEAGNFEGRNILHLQDGFAGDAKVRPEVASALAKMDKLRRARPQPHLDDKVVAAWNGWMIWALVKGARHLEEPRFLAAAQKAMAFLYEELWRPSGLMRFWRDGAGQAAAVAEDYASLIHACLELHQADFNPKWAKWAIELQAMMEQKFADPEGGPYFAGDGGDPHLPLRVRDTYDGVTPSSNSMAALNLRRLYLLTGDSTYSARGEKLQTALFAKLKQYPSGLAFLGMAIDQSLNETAVAVIHGEGWPRATHRKLGHEFHPYIFWTRAGAGWPVGEGKSAESEVMYVCMEGRCLNPARTVVEAEQQLVRF